MAVSTGTYAARPSSHSAGDIYLLRDSFWDYLVSNGTKWRHLYSGFECEPPVDSEFSWVNQGGASVSTANGGVHLHAPAGTGNSYRIRVKAAPAAPYVLTALILPTIPGVNASRLSAGITFRRSSSGKLRMIHFTSYAGLYLEVREHNSPTDAGSQLKIPLLGVLKSCPGVWLRLADDATDLTYSFSTNGQNYVQLYSQSRTDFFLSAPDQLGFITNADDASRDCRATLIHWSLPNPVSTTKVSAFFLGSGMASIKRTGAYAGAFG